VGEVLKGQMKVFSFSVYGDNPIYTIGMLKNIALIREIFPDWHTFIYVPENQNKDYVKKLEENDKVMVMPMANAGFFNSTWRFRAITYYLCEAMECRDADSRISVRDKAAIDEWLASDYKYHIIRDHPGGHHWAMNAGMWGAKRTEFISNIGRMLTDCQTICPQYSKLPTFDQEFLRSAIYPHIVTESMVHDEYYKYEKQAKPINHDRKSNDFAFIGESIDENDVPRGDQRSPIRERYGHS
jgi:hypothetical protein